MPPQNTFVKPSAAMLKERSLKLDLFAVALVALIVFLALSLFSYSPADPLGELVFPLSAMNVDDALVYPAGEEITNVCGRSGAIAATMLLGLLGVGAYYLVASMIVLDVLLLLRRPITSPVTRLIGWILSIVGVTALTGILAPGLSPGPVIGSGGYLGALGRNILLLHFASAGGAILALSLTIGGLLLCTDYALIRIASFVLAAATDGVLGGRRFFTAESGKKAAGDAEEEEQTEDTDELSVRIRGRRADFVEEEEDAEIEDEFEDEEYEDEEIVEEEDKPVEAKKSILTAVSRRLTPRLRVRRPEPEKPKKTEREEVMDQLEAAAQSDEPANYELPSLDLLLGADDVPFEAQEKEVRRKARILEKTFANFGFQVKVVEIETGPVIAQYEVELEAGLRLSRITGLADDLAIALRVPSVRIVAPIPGKNTVGIEVPNSDRQIVRLREVMEELNGRIKKMRIPLFLGKDVSGNPLAVDLSTLPHLLIAGRTGTGKSVCLNAIISSILMTRRPDEVRFLMIDPKMVELGCYKTLPHLMHPVVTDMRKAEAILAWAVEKMEERYELLARAGVRHLSVYNQLGEEELMERLEVDSEEDRKAVPLHLPYIVIVADEIADLMLTSGKEVEQHIIRLAQKSRAVGIHLILATQKPTVDVITGLIKSNLPARISFQVASRTDSRVVLDEMGADRLLGNGDLLFLWPGTSTLVRGQGTYLNDDEINGIVDSVSTGEQHFVKELVHLKVDDGDDGDRMAQLRKRDELYETAVDIVVREGRGSVSLLQRALGIGYGRAARLIDFMAEDGIVGPYAGSQAREVLLTLGDWERMQGNEAEPEPEPAPKRRRRSNKIVPTPEPEYAEEEEEESVMLEEEDFQDEEVDEHADEYEYEEEESDEYDEETDYDEEYDESDEEDDPDDEEAFDESEYEEEYEYDDEEYEEEYEAESA